MKTKPYHKSNWLLISLALVVGILGYDIHAVRSKKATISRMVEESSKRYLIIPFLLGILSGHFFWSMNRDEEKSND